MSKKITEKTLKSAWVRWFFWWGSAQQAENMLGNGVACAMAPVIDELYENGSEEKKAALKRSLALFNTEGQVGAVCPGVFCGLEEAMANGECNDETIAAVKVALIGPTSAIGDSLWVGTIIPLLLTLAMTITNMGGSMIYVGPILYMIGYPILTAFISYKLWMLGYKAGLDGVHQFMSSGKLDILTESMTILGLIVVGALTAANVSVTVPVLITPPGGEAAAIDLNSLINSIFPGLLGVLMTLLVYRLYAKKKTSPLAIMGIIFVISLVLCGLGYLCGVY